MASDDSRSQSTGWTSSTVSRRGFLRRAGLLAATVPMGGAILSACGNGEVAAPAAGGTPAGGGQWRMGIPTLKADSVFQAMGVAQGYFEEEGIQGEIVPIASGTTTVRGVASGSLELGVVGAGPSLSALHVGAPLTIVGTIMSDIPHVMFVRDDIDSLEDLAGETVAADEPGAFLHQLAWASFVADGLDPEMVDYVAIGGSADVFRAVAGGRAAAGVASNEFRIQLDEDPDLPVKVLFRIAEKVPELVRTVDVVPSRLLEEDRDRVVGAITAYVRGARYAVEHRDESLEWILQNTETDPEVAASVWDEYIQDNLIHLDYHVRPEQLEFAQEVGVATGFLGEVLPPSDFLDESVAQEVGERLAALT